MNLEFKIINNEKIWNQFLIQVNNRAFFQDFLWRDIYIKSQIACWSLGIYDQNRLVGLALVHLVRAKRGTFLHLRHGPVVEMKYLNHPYFWQQFLDFIKKEFAKYRMWWIRVSPYVPVNKETEKILTQIGFQPAPIHALDAEVCWVLDITPPEEKLLNNMRKTTRYLVKKARGLGIEIKEVADFQLFAKLYKETAARQKFVIHKNIEAEWATFYKAKRAHMLIAQYEKQILASGIFVRFADQMIYRHGASIKSQIPASYLLQWEAIRYAKKLGIKEYNFWGIAPVAKPNHPWAGITLFKKGFGGKMQEYLHASDLAFSSFYALSYIIEWVRKVSRGY